jgi:nitrogen fixation/metabolism regulation signal transduction histidine kinase
LLSELLQMGVLVVDDQGALRFASPAACDLLGVANESALRDDWPAIAAQFGVTDIARRQTGGAPFQGRVDIRRTPDTRALRFERHTIADRANLTHVILLRDRGHIVPGDRVLLLASEALANRPVLSGLVHEAKGPLNNVGLTLALLAAGVRRADPPAIADEALARWRHHVDVLLAETARLARCLDDIHRLADIPDPARERIDMGALLRDIVRVLRHDATLREIRIELELPDEPLQATGDPQLIRLALTSLTMCVLDVSPPDGNVTWRVEPASDPTTVVLRVSASQCVLPPDLVTEIFRITRTAESAHAAAIAGRMIIEAQGGDVALATGADGYAGFLLRIPAEP